MNARQLRTLSRTLEFASKSNFERIEEFFQIPSRVVENQIEKRLNLWMEPTDEIGKYIFVLQRTEMSLAEREGVALEKLPEDIERLIYGYLKSKNTIRIEIILPHRFPILAPKFKLLSATNGEGTIQRILHRIHCDMDVEYSPALAIQGTLLILLSRILRELQYVS